MNIHTIRNAMVKRAAQAAPRFWGPLTGTAGDTAAFGVGVPATWATGHAILSGLETMMPGAAAGAGAGAVAPVAAALAIPAATVGTGYLLNRGITYNADKKLYDAEQKAARPVPKSMQDQANALRVQRGQPVVRYPDHWTPEGQPVYSEDMQPKKQTPAVAKAEPRPQLAPRPQPKLQGSVGASTGKPMGRQSVLQGGILGSLASNTPHKQRGAGATGSW